MTAKAETHNGQGYQVVPLARVRPWPGNPRKTFDEASLKDLAESLRSKGVLQPLLVRPMKAGANVGHYEIADGERRYRAAKLAGLPDVPVRVLDLSDRDMLEIAVVSFEQREDVGPLEKAEGYHRLVTEHDVPVEEIARRIGRSASTVRNLLKLRNVPDRVRKAVEAGELSASVAGLIARVPTPFLRERVAAAVLLGMTWHNPESFRNPKVPIKRQSWDNGPREPLDYRDTKELIARNCTVELKGSPFDRKALDLVPEAGSCEACPKRVGNLQAQDPEGYEGVRADVCTDPACFRAKVQAHNDRAREKAKAEGREVLAGKKAEALFWGSGGLKSDAPYVGLDDRCHDDPKGRTYRKLVGKQLARDVVLAEDGEGNLHELLPKDRVIPLLREQKIRPDRYASPGGGRTSEEEKREKAKRQAENRVRRETDRAVLAAAHDTALAFFQPAKGAGGEKGLAVLRQVAHDAASHVWGTTGEEICRRRDLKAKHVTDQREEIGRLIDAADVPGLLALLAEFTAGRGLIGWAHGEAGRALSKALGIDRKKLEQGVRSRIKQEKAAKKAGKQPEASANGHAAKPAGQNGKAAATADRVFEEAVKALGADEGLLRAAAAELARMDGEEAGAHHAAEAAQYYRDLVRDGKKPGDIYTPGAPVHERAAAALPHLRGGKQPRRASVKSPPDGKNPVTRETRLAALLSGAELAYEQCVQLLEGAGLRTVGDLLERAKGAKGPEAQRPYTVLREVKGLDILAVNVIGDWLIDAGLTWNPPGAAEVLQAAAGQEKDPVVKRRLGAMAGDLRGEARGRCRVCGCTEHDCRGCVERTGRACSWASDLQDLCTACVDLWETPLDHRHCTAQELRALKEAGCESVGDLVRLGPAPKGIPRTRLTVLQEAAERWLKTQLALAKGAAAPWCQQCGANGGEVVDNVRLVDADEDLVPVALVDPELLRGTGIPEVTEEELHVCGACLERLRGFHKGKGRKKAAAGKGV